MSFGSLHGVNRHVRATGTLQVVPGGEVPVSFLRCHSLVSKSALLCDVFLSSALKGAVAVHLDRCDTAAHQQTGSRSSKQHSWPCSPVCCSLKRGQEGNISLLKANIWILVSENEPTEGAEDLHKGPQETPTVHGEPSQEGNTDFLGCPQPPLLDPLCTPALPALALGRGWSHCWKWISFHSLQSGFWSWLVVTLYPLFS